MAMVWACAVSVDEYRAAGRDVVVPRPGCPGCGAPMSFWSGYERSLRCGGRCLRLWVRRARCGPCRATHVLLPSFCLVGRLDVVEVIGEVVAGVVGAGGGVRPVAARVEVPYTTARDWVRRFARRAGVVAAGFAALVVELSGWAPRLPAEAARQALAAIWLAFSAARVRAGPVLPGLWGFAALVSGGRLLAANSDSLSIVLGKRRFIPPVP